MSIPKVPMREGQDNNEQEAEVDAETSLAPTVLEQQYVHEFYETVAMHFSSTRHSPWPKVPQFVVTLPSGSVIADIGCGNGKYVNSRLVNICRDRGLETMVCDALAVPLRSNSCDAALSIAVLHHLSTLGHRLAAVKELLRVLRVSGVESFTHGRMSR
ncbi:unnamed protein product [Peronospora destructor]|uniref:Methyltransferase type 11 domain-containing protein n=1 Tax=Peronospora destructor TaxID=86335 RepID=A0AAV0UW20_9STRA|nr:unnamed protein product [Peronospora destructor]